jgi:hypothetical protein
MQKLDVPDTVIDAVSVLIYNKKKNQSYHVYMIDVKKNDMARKVNVA